MFQGSGTGVALLLLGAVEVAEEMRKDSTQTNFVSY